MVRVSGDGSWQKLIANAYGAKIRTVIQGYREYDIKISPDETLKQYIYSFNYTGYYHRINGVNSDRELAGYLWEKTIYSDLGAYYLTFYYASLNPQSSYSKEYGFSVRCVAK